jgi:hypothetical protein
VPNKKTGRTYLQISEGYRDAQGKSKSRCYEKLGYLDELEKTTDDPIAHYTEYAKELTAKLKSARDVTIRTDRNERVEKGIANRKNYGYIVLDRIYRELELDRFFNNKRRHERFRFNSEAIARLLVFSRILYPDSKKKTVEIKERFFDKFDFDIDDVYDCLTHFSKCDGDAQLHIHRKVSERYGRDNGLMFYDVTNYYFETDVQDDERRKGCCKEHRTDPVIQMGMAIDGNGIPMAYKLFPGNTNDSETYIPVLKRIKKQFDIRRIVVVADKGLNCGDNIVFNAALGDGYVFSQSVRGASVEFKNYVLDRKGYGTPTKEGFMCKSRVIPAKAKISDGVTKSGRRSTKTVFLESQKQVVFYSPKYAVRAKKKREETLQKAVDLIGNPSKYTRATHCGAAAYIANIDFDKDTGEILETGKKLCLDTEKIREAEKFDGYYAIVTSETEESDARIIDAYRGLWRIEDTFKVTKSVLRTRPVFVYNKEHVHGHFLTCYIALVILRLTELRLGGRFSAERIANVLREVVCTRLDTNNFAFCYADEVTDAMNEAFSLDIGRKYMTLAEIRSEFAAVKAPRRKNPL